MNALAAEWVSKAERDLDTAFLVMAEDRIDPFPDVACFHGQQCAEKYLKAYLQEHHVRFAPTHNLIDHLELCRNVDPGFATLGADLRELDGYAVRVRYPGVEVSFEMGEAALAAASRVRAFIRAELGLE